jgi:hypothetical protein
VSRKENLVFGSIESHRLSPAWAGMDGAIFLLFMARVAGDEREYPFSVLGWGTSAVRMGGNNFAAPLIFI